MVKRTNRAAWWLSAILVLVLLGGTGMMLDHGIRLGMSTVQVSPNRRWFTPGPVATVDTPATTAKIFSGGFFSVVITRPRKP